MRSHADAVVRGLSAAALMILAFANLASAELIIDKVRPGRPGANVLYILFKPPAPAPAEVSDKGLWEVTAFTASAAVALPVAEAFAVQDDYAVTGLVTLRLTSPLPGAYERIEVRYKSANHPLGVLTAEKPEPSPGVVPVDDPKKADVYLSGIFLPATGEKPLYTIDSRGSYVVWLGGTNEDSSWDVNGSAKADKRPNADLDSFLVGATYQRIATMANVRWFTGPELNRKARVVNLVTAPQAIWPWTRNFTRTTDGVTTLRATVGWTVDATIETGFNFRNAYHDPEDDDDEGGGSGWLLRVVPSTTLYVVKPSAGWLDRVSVTARYTVRLLTRDELFLETRKSHGVTKDPIPQLNRRARHLAQVTAAFMLSKFAGVEVKYQYGSEPPAFRFVNHSGSVGLVVKFRQPHRPK